MTDDAVQKLIANTREFFAQPLRDTAALQRQHLNQDEGGVDRQTVVVLISVALLLTVRSYFFNMSELYWLANKTGWQWLRVALSNEHSELTRLTYWCLGQNLTYVLAPWLLIRFVLRQPLSDFGVKFRGMFQYAWAYAVMFLVMAPLIVWLSNTDSFQHQYPFYRLRTGESVWPKVIIWELLYATQFMALEFFFRGYMVHGTKHQFGAYCVFVMAVPYCMIHFGKPLPETLGAVIAGVVLGLMSLKTRSIWMGAALHIAVAWSMDTAALLSR